MNVKYSLKNYFFINFAAILTCALVSVSCSKEKDSNFQSRIKFDAKPQVKDVLKGKSNSEVMKMKYKELALNCTLITEKITRGQLLFDTASSSTTPPPPADAVTNPRENSIVYDLKLQQMIDRELTKEVTGKLTTAKDGQVLNVDMTIRPVSFQEALNVDVNKKKYLMKHSPIISYMLHYSLIHTDTSTIVGKAQGRIFEKIDGQKSDIIAIEIGNDKYNFVLNCGLQRTINPENAAQAAEFENQWTEVDCHAPKNEEERAVCR